MRTFDELPQQARAFVYETLADADGEPGTYTLDNDGDEGNPPWTVLIEIALGQTHHVWYSESVDYQSYPATQYEPGYTGWTDMEEVWHGVAPAIKQH